LNLVVDLIESVSPSTGFRRIRLNATTIILCLPLPRTDRNLCAINCHFFADYYLFVHSDFENANSCSSTDIANLCWNIHRGSEFNHLHIALAMNV